MTKTAHSSTGGGGGGGGGGTVVLGMTVEGVGIGVWLGVERTGFIESEVNRLVIKVSVGRIVVTNSVEGMGSMEVVEDKVGTGVGVTILVEGSIIGDRVAEAEKKVGVEILAVRVGTRVENKVEVGVEILAVRVGTRVENKVEEVGVGILVEGIRTKVVEISEESAIVTHRQEMTSKNTI